MLYCLFVWFLFFFTTARRESFPCISCNKSIKNNHNSIYCISCCKWIHLKCSSISKNEFLSLSNDSSDWFCNRCLECIFPFNNIQDDFEFNCYPFNLSSSNKSNANLIKNSQQLQLTKMSGSKLCNSDIGPDKFFFKQSGNSGNKYYLEDEFNNLVHDNRVESYFSLLHINARSLAKNLHRLIVYLKTFNHTFHVIAISETWANNANYSFLNISRYNSHTNYRTERRGGGVALYIHESLTL